MALPDRQVGITLIDTSECMFPKYFVKQKTILNYDVFGDYQQSELFARQ